MQKKSLDAVLERLMTVFAVDSDSELARKLDVNRQTLGSWRSRQSIPYALCVNVSEAEGVSLDWLLTGEGTMMRGVSVAATDLLATTPQEDAILALFRSLEETDRREIQSAAEEKKRIRDIEQRLKDLTEALADTKRPA
ncbi:helix-turn-helix domain containing protein [Pseudomonas extremorientalis]|uniref:helix-turn-helix domain containing protein n=1 Tax=Pseudomonas extremorientalis TaxID=169669 RepID=UPI00211C0BDF|nr:helix-turn-helix domain containing protein [Pseudomonas extremorientalis]UUN90353.1 helix-turn-helix domain containing protein [Pseudomonas extremorientalis]